MDGLPNRHNSEIEDAPAREMTKSANAYAKGIWLTKSVQMMGDGVLAIGDWLLAIGDWLLVIGDWLLAIGDR